MLSSQKLNNTTSHTAEPCINSYLKRSSAGQAGIRCRADPWQLPWHAAPQGCNVLLSDAHPIDEVALTEAGQGGPLPPGVLDPHSPNPFIHSIMTIVDLEVGGDPHR